MNVTYSTSTSMSGAALAAVLLISLVLIVFYVFVMWRVYTKAGKPGWACIVPFYNIVVLLEIVGRPIWWILLYLIPGVNLVILIIVYLDLAKVFGKSSGFALGMIFLSFIFLPILAFGPARYLGPGGPSGAAPPVPPPPPPGGFTG